MSHGFVSQLIEKFSSAEIKKAIDQVVFADYKIQLGDDVMNTLVEFSNSNFVWKTRWDGYQVSSDEKSVESLLHGGWSRWAYTEPAFIEDEQETISIRIDRKRPDQGWLTIGVIRKSFVDSRLPQGGFTVYNQHAIMVDPSWHTHESHFNLKELDVSKQKAIVVGDVVHICVDSKEKEITFLLNDDVEPFARGDWARIDCEPVYGYAILTTSKDRLTIL